MLVEKVEGRGFLRAILFCSISGTRFLVNVHGSLFDVSLPYVGSFYIESSFAVPCLILEAVCLLRTLLVAR